MQHAVHLARCLLRQRRFLDQSNFGDSYSLRRSCRVVNLQSRVRKVRASDIVVSIFFSIIPI